MRVFKKKVLLRHKPWMKKRRRRERSRDDRSQVDNIPLDLTLEILSRLPPKSIMRCRSVSKLWSSFTTLASFINSFASWSSARPPCLLLTFEFDDSKQLVISFPQNQNPDGSYPPIYGYHTTGICNHQSPQSESVQGLVLLCGLRIWNPSLRRVFTLPHPEEPVPNFLYNGKSYLGYDPLEGKHKVLHLFYWKKKNYVQPLVLTLGAQETWRIITKGRCPMHSPEGEGRCFNGVVYYEAEVGGHNIIMSFDFKSESFSPIKYPEYSHDQSYSRSHFQMLETMLPYEGRLALVTEDKFSYNSVYLYISEDEDGHEWTRHLVPRFLSTREGGYRMQFKGATDAGELIFAPWEFVDSFYFLYFDPKTEITREAFFEGFVGYEFRGRRGVNNPTQRKSVFPNHMESIVCL